LYYNIDAIQHIAILVPMMHVNLILMKFPSFCRAHKERTEPCG